MDKSLLFRSQRARFPGCPTRARSGSPTVAPACRGLSSGAGALVRLNTRGAGSHFTGPWETRHMILRPVARAVALTAIVTLGSLALSACGSGTSGGGGQTNFVTGADGIATVAKDERKPVGSITGETLQGKPLDVADFQGKVLVINVWGSWCPPCRAEAPYLNEVAKEMKTKGVEFLGINTRDSDKSAPKAFEDDYDISYPSLFDPTGKMLLSGFPKGTVTLQGVPATVVLDRNGKIAARAFGGVNENKLHKMIDPVVREK